MATTPFSVCKEFCAGGGGGTPGASNAKDVKYDNKNSGLKADNVGGAIDELCGKAVPSDLSQNDETAPDYVKNRTHYESKVLMAEFINAQPWENKTLLEPIDLKSKYVININGADVETTVDGTNEDYRFNYDGQPVFQAWCNESSNEITVYPEFEGQNVSLYKISVKQLDEKYIPDTVARTKSDIANIEYTGNGFKATFSAPLEVGMQLFYSYTVDGMNVSGMSKPIKLNSNNKLEVVIGNEYQTVTALTGICDIGSKVMTFTFINESDFQLSVVELSIPVPIPFKFLGMGNGLNVGYNNVVTEDSVNSNNFGSNNYNDGNFNNIFGTGNRIESAQSSAIFGQDSTILANLCYLFGDRNNSIGRCTLGVGSLIDILATNSGAIGYGLKVSGDNQLVAGRFNEPDADAVIIIGDGADDNNRSNAYVVKKNGQVYIKGELLLKLTQKDKDKLNSFSSTGDQNTDTGRSTAQFGFGNKNAQDNVMQLGRQNTTEGSKGGYIYQTGYANSSSAGQNYQWGRNLKSAVYEQWVAGKYNAEDKDALYIFGNGTSETDRKNAFVVKKTNDVYFEGNVYSNGNKLLTGSDLNSFSGTIAGLVAKIEALENERIVLNDSISLMYSNINALTARIEELENK